MRMLQLRQKPLPPRHLLSFPFRRLQMRSLRMRMLQLRQFSGLRSRHPLKFRPELPQGPHYARCRYRLQHRPRFPQGLHPVLLL